MQTVNSAWEIEIDGADFTLYPSHGCAAEDAYLVGSYELTMEYELVLDVVRVAPTCICGCPTPTERELQPALAAYGERRMVDRADAQRLYEAGR